MTMKKTTIMLIWRKASVLGQMTVKEEAFDKQRVLKTVVNDMSLFDFDWARAFKIEIVKIKNVKQESTVEVRSQKILEQLEHPTEI